MIQCQPPPPPPQVESAPAQGDAVFFYESLRPHGTWLQVSPFGVVWRPNVVVRNAAWRPYSDGGRWIWVNNTWYWHSEYEWGWAPFHYGRWMRSGHLGWVWVPGREWSAAWVTWRQTPTHYDWAPLPVETSVRFGVSSTTDSGLTWAFQFSVTDDHYVSAPRHRFPGGDVVYVHPGAGRDADHRSYDRHERREHRESAPVVEVVRQPAPAPAPVPSRRTTMIQQQVTAPKPQPAPAQTRSVQQVVSKPAANPQPKEVSKSDDSKESKDAGRRTSRILDIMARSRR
ncbi:MAG: hypothetical protein C0404_02060 [Verrucomicrobia bacterium]|nr:hypothetical protein [Verrucomicrobiota bacterium]